MMEMMEFAENDTKKSIINMIQMLKYVKENINESNTKLNVMSRDEKQNI